MDTSSPNNHSSHVFPVHDASPIPAGQFQVNDESTILPIDRDSVGNQFRGEDQDSSHSLIHPHTHHFLEYLEAGFTRGSHVDPEAGSSGGIHAEDKDDARLLDFTGAYSTDVGSGVVPSEGRYDHHAEIDGNGRSLSHGDSAEQSTDIEDHFFHPAASENEEAGVTVSSVHHCPLHLILTIWCYGSVFPFDQHYNNEKNLISFEDSLESFSHPVTVSRPHHRPFPPDPD